MISNIIKDIKMGFTLSKYGLKVKLQLGMAAFFFAIGVVVDIVSKGSSYIGGFYIILAGMFIFQCIISMDASTLIQSSGYNDDYQMHFLVHECMTEEKPHHEEEIAERVVQYMILKTIKQLRLDSPEKVDGFLKM